MDKPIKNTSNKKKTMEVPVLDPKILFATNAFIDFQKEQFILRLASGPVTGQYAFTPQHFQRFVSAMTKKLKMYEDIFDKIKQ